MAKPKALIAPTPETALVQQKADAIVTRAEIDRYTLIVEQFVVADKDSAQQLTDIAGEIAAAESRFEEFIGPPIAAAHAVHDFLCKLARPTRQALEALKDKAKRKVAVWKLDEEARLARIEREAAELAERQRRQAEAEAQKLLRQGKVSEARELREVAEAIAAPIISADSLKLEGSRDTFGWEHTVTDFAALVRAVAQGTVPLEALLPNEKFLKAQASARGKDLNWPGVAVKRSLSLAISARE